MGTLTARDIDVRGRRVLLRTDYNVEVVGAHILDDLRLRGSVPTIRLLCEAGARIAICSHRGRPRGRRIPQLSNAPVAEHLATLLDAPVHSVGDCVGPAAEAAVAALPPGGVLLLENVRFHPGEEANDDSFAQQLARLGDCYVDDAFGTIHRAHASIVGVPRYLPAVAGLLVERELKCLGYVERSGAHPFALVLGGVKIADKLPLLEHLLPRLDALCIGGALACALLQVRGIDVRASRVDAAAAQAAARVLRALEGRGGLRVVLPTDVVVTRGTGDGAEPRTVPVTEVPDGWRIVDIGPETVAAFVAALAGARTVVWNGPLGVFEQPPFDAGTLAIARAVAALSATTVVGGGETAAAVRQAGVADRIWHVSTGGGAALQYLSGRPLPGLDALDDAPEETAAVGPAESRR